MSSHQEEKTIEGTTRFGCVGPHVFLCGFPRLADHAGDLFNADCGHPSVRKAAPFPFLLSAGVRWNPHFRPLSHKFGIRSSPPLGQRRSRRRAMACPQPNPPPLFWSWPARRQRFAKMPCSGLASSTDRRCRAGVCSRVEPHREIVWFHSCKSCGPLYSFFSLTAAH